MKTKILLILITFFYLPTIADEGMWLPQLLKSINEADMKEKGLMLSAEDLYSINNSSLKDAIVALNGGSCTGEMISKEGLLLTNHHCAFSQIQSHSSVKNDYLKNGFWAMSKSEELENEGLSVSFLVEIEDVTNEILSGITKEMTEKERSSEITKKSKLIIEKKTKENHFNARVKSFFGGNKYYIMVYETFNDVRLVGAPPSSIGKFGGDTDNWMWPRHTGDFALFRVYCAPDGTPASYSSENVPLKPKHHLPVQLEGVQNGDYTMIFGFPGSTDRYLTSYGVKEALEITNPTIVKIRDKKLSIMKEGMDSDKKIEIQYAAKYAQTSNYWKYYIGQSKGLKRMGVYEKKLSIENDFISWVNKNQQRKKKYGNALKMIEEAYKENNTIALNRTFLNEAIFMGSEIMYFSFKMQRAFSQLPKEKIEKEKAIEKIKEDAKSFYKNYNTDIDRKLFASMLELYYYTVPKEQHASIFKTIENQLLGFKKLDFDFYAKNAFEKSIFSSQEKFLEFLKFPSLNKINMDPAYKTLMSIYNQYLDNIYQTRLDVRQKLKKGNRLFIAGIQEMNPKGKFYPNANSTMRVTYGNVGDYNPGDAVHYDYYTTIEGIIEKEDSSNQEFIVPEKLKDLYLMKDYGDYADENGDLRINFISNNDITGGNSGSPVINAWGELVGTAFDGNWEAMSGDIAFENTVQRTISVDIRYVLFIIDKFAGATHLIKEMTIAPKRENEIIKNSTTVEKTEIVVETKINYKEFLGNMYPVIKEDLFEVAFKKAKTEYGVSKNQKFWWQGNIYTTDQL